MRGRVRDAARGDDIARSLLLSSSRHSTRQGTAGIGPGPLRRRSRLLAGRLGQSLGDRATLRAWSHGLYGCRRSARGNAGENHAQCKQIGNLMGKPQARDTTVAHHRPVHFRFLQVEWFGDAVVGADLQADDEVDQFMTAADDDGPAPRPSRQSRG